MTNKENYRLYFEKGTKILKFLIIWKVYKVYTLHPILIQTALVSIIKWFSVYQYNVLYVKIYFSIFQVTLNSESFKSYTELADHLGKNEENSIQQTLADIKALSITVDWGLKSVLLIFFQVYQYFTSYRWYFLIKIWTIFMNILYNTL